jgi:hypothetical protein
MPPSARRNKGELMTRVLLLGLDPETVDFLTCFVTSMMLRRFTPKCGWHRGNLRNADGKATLA